MKHRPLATALALIAIATSALAPTDAVATQPTLDPFERIPAAGVGPDGTEFLGTLDVLHFEARGTDLVAVGTLSGQVTRVIDSAASPVATLDEAPVSVPVNGLAATCQHLSVEFGRVPLDLHGPAVAIDPIRVDGSTRPADDAWPEEELCAIADRLQRDAAPRSLAGLLEAVAQSFN